MKTIKRGAIWLLTTLILLSSVGMIGCSSSNSNTSASATLKFEIHDSEANQESLISESSNNPIDIVTAPQASELKVHFIDVGQGDSILIQSGAHDMLVDAGENDKGDTVVTYLHSQGIDKLDYVIGTHPHSDHIGGLDDVIHNFTIDTLIMPAVEHTTKTYEDVLNAASGQGLKINKPEVGKTYQIGDASFQIIAPNGNYGDDLNNWSVGIKLTNGNNSFVMCGDAEGQAEAAMCTNSIDLSADILKLGHHGSNTSTSNAFLNKVNPKYAVISCGLGNSYGHPHQETMDKLIAKGVQIFRTDEQGTIIATSDGSKISWSTQPSTSGKTGNKKDDTISQETITAPATVSVPSTEAQKSGLTYVLNTKTKKFHKTSCGSLPTTNRKDTDMSRDEIINAGYVACKKCNP